MNDLNRFISFEVTNFQTIMDLAQKVQSKIKNQSQKSSEPVNEEIKYLESLLNP